MNLIYVWVESYRCLKKCGFKFDSKYTVDFQRDKMKLEIKSNENYIDNILYGKNIGVTAIVGDNGAGKSTVLDFIRGIIFDNENFKKEASGYIAWDENGKIKIYSFMNPKLVVEKPLLEVDTFLQNDTFGLIYFSDLLDLKYYNNHFDDGEDVITNIPEEEVGPFSFRNRDWIQYNISTSYLLRNNLDNVLNYFHEEIKKQLYFYKSIREEVKHALPFPVPSSITVELSYLDINIFNNVLDDRLSSYEYMGIRHKGENNTSSFTIGMLKQLKRIYESKTTKNLQPITVNQIVEWDIFIVYIYNLLKKRKDENKERDNYDEVDNVLKEMFCKKLPDEDSFFNILNSIFESYNSTLDFKEYKMLYKNIQQFLIKGSKGDIDIIFKIPINILNLLRFTMIQESYGKGTIDEGFYQSVIDGNEDLEYKYMEKMGWDGKRNMDDFLALFTAYANITYNIDFFVFNWGMSSGENSMFSLFSRLYDVMERIKLQNINDIILILDELDYLYHPRWQQRIMKSLIGFLRNTYSHIAFQIILTTHSPVLLSDIPKPNIIFIKKYDKEGTTEKDHSQTFAANIATLYYDSFFMENGSIGEISHGCIENLFETINIVNKEKIQNNEKRIVRFVSLFLQRQFDSVDIDLSLSQCKNIINKIHYLINSIGEDIWRFKLEKQFLELNLELNFENYKEEKKQKILYDIMELINEEGEEALNELMQKVNEVKINDFD